MAEDGTCFDDDALRRSATVGLEAIRALGLVDLLESPQALFRIAEEALVHALERTDATQRGRIPDSLLGREVVKSLAAELETEIQGAVERIPRERTRDLERLVQRNASPGESDRPGNPAWFDPRAWEAPDGLAARPREHRLLLLGYAAYYLLLQEKALEETRAGARSLGDLAARCTPLGDPEAAAGLTHAQLAAAIGRDGRRPWPATSRSPR